VRLAIDTRLEMATLQAGSHPMAGTAF